MLFDTNKHLWTIYYNYRRYKHNFTLYSSILFIETEMFQLSFMTIFSLITIERTLFSLIYSNLFPLEGLIIKYWYLWKHLVTVLTIFMCSIPFLINEKGIKTLGNAKSESWVETNKVKTFTKMKKDIKFTFITTSLSWLWQPQVCRWQWSRSMSIVWAPLGWSWWEPLINPSPCPARLLICINSCLRLDWNGFNY